MVEISTTTVGRSYGRLEGRAKVTDRLLHGALNPWQVS